MGKEDAVVGRSCCAERRIALHRRMNHDGCVEGVIVKVHAFALLRRGGADARKYDGAPARTKESMIRRC
jgi:hypothetical protein